MKAIGLAGGYSWDGVRHSGRQFCAVAMGSLFVPQVAEGRLPIARTPNWQPPA